MQAKHDPEACICLMAKRETTCVQGHYSTIMCINLKICSYECAEKSRDLPFRAFGTKENNAAHCFLSFSLDCIPLGITNHAFKSTHHPCVLRGCIYCQLASDAANVTMGISNDVSCCGTDSNDTSINSIVV